MEIFETAVEYVMRRRFGGRCQLLKPRAVTMGLTPIDIATPTGERVFLMVVNNGGSTVFLGIDTEPIAGQGVRLTANGGTLISWADDDGPATSAWYRGLVASGTPSVTVYEALRYHRSEV